VLHPQKTKIVYCKDVNRRGGFLNIHFDFLGFQFRARKIMWVKAERRIFAHSFLPAASPKASTRISGDIRSWALHHRSDKSVTELAQMYNPCIRGWITYHSHFYGTPLRPTLKRIEAYVIRWARRKFKRMRHQTKGTRDWFDGTFPLAATKPMEPRRDRASLRVRAVIAAHASALAFGR